MIIITIKKAAMIQMGDSTHHHDHVITLHHFRTANTAASSAGQPNLNTTLLFIFSYFYVEGCRVERRAKLSVSVVCSPEAL